MSAPQSDVSDLLGGPRPAAPAHATLDPVSTTMSLPEAVAFCRANGIRKLTYRGMEIEFAATAAPTTSEDDRQKFADAMAGAIPSDTEFLGWSAPEFPRDLAEMAKTLGIAGFEDKE